VPSPKTPKAARRWRKAATFKGTDKPDCKPLTADEGHVERLAQICEGIGSLAKGKKCKGWKGLLIEKSEVIEEDDAERKVKDASTDCRSPRSRRHYEIAGYALRPNVGNRYLVIGRP